MTTGQIAKQMPGLSRFAVMQHLDVLVEASLVLVRREGRNRFNYANPVPLQEAYDRWVSGFSSSAAKTLRHLKRYAESEPKENLMNETVSGFRVVRIELESIVHAPPDRVFRALTSELDEWWPHRMRPDAKIVHECKVGGSIREDWPNGGALYATVTVFEDGKRHASVASGFMGGCCQIANEESVEAIPEGTRVRKALRFWGVVPEEVETMFREGASSLLSRALKSYCEEGVRYEHSA